MNFNPDPIGEDQESLAQSERDALEHEAQAERAREAWCNLADSPGAASYIATDDGDILVTSVGDNHGVVERLTGGEYAAFLVDSTDMGLTAFYFSVVEPVSAGNSPKQARELPPGEAEEYLDADY